ncbi:MAG: zf-TFIIB domain-containing protein [Proteobacteria bacterium]|nr:zf-TFIIB domain-containing protein [Pseudomonadota bacterium]
MSAAAMLCPICKLELVDDEPGQRLCARCKGSWLEPARLTALLHAAAPHVVPLLSVDSISDAALPPNVAAKHRRDCPICTLVMRSGTLFAVLVDRCDAHGVWVDAGELSRSVLAARRHDRAR